MLDYPQKECWTAEAYGRFFRREEDLLEAMMDMMGFRGFTRKVGSTMTNHISQDEKKLGKNGRFNMF